MLNVIDFIFPPNCVYCNNVGHLICNSCLAKCELNTHEECVVCQRGSVGGDTHKECRGEYTPDGYFNIFKYSGNVREIIRKSKYGRFEFALLRKLTEHGVEILSNKGLRIPSCISLVPIPLNKKRFQERGFNQAKIICKVLEKKYKLNIEEDLLKRVKNTQPQHSNDINLRHTNISQAFLANEKILNKIISRKRTILLVDDICTSGATFMEATKTIKYLNSGVKVYCMSLAKGELRSSTTKT